VFSILHRAPISNALIISDIQHPGLLKSTGVGGLAGCSVREHEELWHRPEKRQDMRKEEAPHLRRAESDGRDKRRTIVF